MHLFDDPFVVVARPGHFDPGPFPVSALADEALIGQNPNSCQLLNERGLRERGLDPDYVFRSSDNVMSNTLAFAETTLPTPTTPPG